MKAALDRTTRRLDLPANTAPVERSAPTPAVPPGLSSGSAAIGLGKAEAKAKLEIGGDEQSALVQNLSRDLEQMIAQLTKLLASEAPTAQARAKAAARVKAGRAALATLPQASLDPALASALASIAAALKGRAQHASPSEARWLPELSEQVQALAGLTKAEPPRLARSYHSAAETFRVWSEAYRRDPAETVEQFRAAFGVPIDAAALTPVLHKLLGQRSGRRAFIQATRAWLRPELKAHSTAEGAVTTLRPKLHGGRLTLASTTRITEASQIPPMSRDPSGKVGSLVVVGQGPIGLLTAVLTKAQPANAGTAVYLVDKRGADGEIEYSRPIKLAVRNGFLSLLAGARAPGSKQSVLDLLRERGQVHFLEEASAKGLGEISQHRTAHQPRGVISEDHSAIIETRHLERAIRDVAAKIPGIHFLNGYRPKLTATGELGLDGQPTFSVSLERGGKSHAIGTPDMIVAADGASSHTVRDAGIGLKVGQAIGRYVAGTVRVPTSDKNVLAKLKVDNGTPLGARVYANTVGSLGESWMIVDLPATWTSSDLVDTAKVSAYFKQMCGKALGQSPTEVDVSYGGALAFTLRPTITTEAGRGNVMPVGDASGNNTFVVGAGTVGGAHEALIAAQTIAALNGSSSPEDAAGRLSKGLERSYLAAAAWHQAGPKAVQQDLELKALLKKNVIEPRRARAVGAQKS